MLLRSSSELHYPVTVTELLRKPNDTVEKAVRIFRYNYTTKVPQGPERTEVPKEYLASVESPIDGKVTKWFIKPGDIIRNSGYCARDCYHMHF
jgi:RNA polymerase II subunit A C-terminal domain phosphatase